MSERISQRTVSLSTQGERCLVWFYTDHGGTGGGYSGGNMIGTMRPVVAQGISVSISFLRAYMSDDRAALPETQKFNEEHATGHKKDDRQVTVRSARNGFIVEPAFFDIRGWCKAIGDEVVFTDLELMLQFCTNYLEGVPGTNWWESPPWKEARAT